MRKIFRKNMIDVTICDYKIDWESEKKAESKERRREVEEVEEVA